MESVHHSQIEGVVGGSVDVKDGAQNAAALTLKRRKRKTLQWHTTRKQGWGFGYLLDASMYAPVAWAGKHPPGFLLDGMSNRLQLRRSSRLTQTPADLVHRSEPMPPLWSGLTVPLDLLSEGVSQYCRDPPIIKENDPSGMSSARPVSPPPVCLHTTHSQSPFLDVTQFYVPSLWFLLTRCGPIFTIINHTQGKYQQKQILTFHMAPHGRSKRGSNSQPASHHHQHCRSPTHTHAKND